MDTKLVVQKHGPFEPPRELLVAAMRVVVGVDGPSCMDCSPDFVLTDVVCEDCGAWEWELLVAHDGTCPTANGVLAPPEAPSW